ncbi:MAG: GDYXXLXY domain-containing protein [Synechococcaceae cyanobacterium SM2_3_1]|nr:GDYXXLXY domain-containing protein [Synechococcaceae cyanobacterium SM2_3_1]
MPYTLATGTTVYLQTAPVDPYDVLRGRYVTLGYVITRFDQLESLPGWSEDFRQAGTELYLVIETSGSGARSPWQAVAIYDHYPQNLPPQQQVIKGHWRYDTLQIGLSEYYIPEEIGDALEADMRQQNGEALAEVKVDGSGNPALVQLWVEDRAY